MPYHVGGSQGHEVEIKGTGFSKNVADYSCTVAGHTCSVKDLNTTKLTVVIPTLNISITDFGALPKDTTDTQPQQGAFLGSNGFRYTRYSIGSYKSTADWLTLVRGVNNLTVLTNEIKT